MSGISAEVDTKAFKEALAQAGGGEPSVIIGFNAHYAAPVHENLTAHHDQGQAKFLEAAIRAGIGRQVVEKAVALAMGKISSAAQIHQAVSLGVELAAVQILGDAQQLCPVDTGYLAASGTWQGVDGPGSGENPGGKAVGPSRATAKRKKEAAQQKRARAKALRELQRKSKFGKGKK